MKPNYAYGPVFFNFLPHIHALLRSYPQTQEIQEIVLPKSVTKIQGLMWAAEQDNSLVVNVNRYASGSQETRGNQTWLLDVTTGAHEILVDCESLVDNAYCRSQLSPQGTRVAVFTYERLHILEPQSGKITLYELPEGTDWEVYEYTWSPDGRRLVLEGEALLLLDLDSGEMETLLPAYSHDPLIGQLEWVSYNSSRWLDDNHIAVIWTKSQYTAFHFAFLDPHPVREKSRLQVVRIEDRMVWTVFEHQFVRQGSPKFDWTSVSE